MKGRKFKLWYYGVSHSQLLLRSVGADGNIDLYFGDVKYVEVPVILNGVEIVLPEKEDYEHLRERINNLNDEEVTVLSSGGNKYYVVSSIFKIMENNLEMFELPFDV